MKLHLVRGLPGSGKSTFAKTLGCFHVEADMFFMRDGEYHFNKEHIAYAHAWCIDATFTALNSGLDVVVSNTFIRLWELNKYIKLAETWECEVIVYRMNKNYQSIHNVSQDICERMKRNYEPYKDEVVLVR